MDTSTFSALNTLWVLITAFWYFLCKRFCTGETGFTRNKKHQQHFVQKSDGFQHRKR
jgi:hypothetical protein